MQRNLDEARKTLAVQNAQLNDLYKRIEDLNSKLSVYSKKIDDLTNQLNNRGDNRGDNRIGAKNITLTVGLPQNNNNNMGNKGNNYGYNGNNNFDNKDYKINNNGNNRNNDDVDIDQILKKYDIKTDNNDSKWDDRNRSNDRANYGSDIFIGSGLN